MNHEASLPELDAFTRDLFDELFCPAGASNTPTQAERRTINELMQQARGEGLAKPIVDVFRFLLHLRDEKRLTPRDLGLEKSELVSLAEHHQALDEHGVSIGGRCLKALPIVREANARVADYLERHREEAPTGIELWDKICTNRERIKQILNMGEDRWNSFGGQLKYAIESVDTLSQIMDLPQETVIEIQRVTRHYRMRLTPYYASLIMPGAPHDPIMLQSVPTAEMLTNAGSEVPPVAADHSPARLIDQFYPRVVAMKATNMCGMYCTHCLRIAHIGRKDRIYPREAYTEALQYIRDNPRIRDVLITGGDAFVLPNETLAWILAELDHIEHVRLKRLGSRIPVTTPQRINGELLDILGRSNDKKPLRVVTQINTAREITPVSREAFRKLSGRVSAVLNQAVLLKGINDSTVKMWKLCETIQEAYVRPYYVFNCSYRNPQFDHLRVPVERGRDIIESMYGNISGDAIPRYIATAGGKIPLHRSNVLGRCGSDIILKKPWDGQEVKYPDAG